MKENEHTADEKQVSMAASLKSGDTEEWIDLMFYRPLGYQWALLFRKAGISPNAITVAAIFLGVVAGFLFYFADLRLNVAGMFLLVWANTYDSADGQLARMTGQSSEMGRILDGVCGDLWFIAIYVAICFRLMPAWSYGIWLLAAAAGYFHSKQAAMADYYRNIHLFFIKGRSGSELIRSEEVRQQFAELPWKGNVMKKLFLWFYGGYTASQEKMSPHFQELYQFLCREYGDDAPSQVGRLFRVGSLPLMKYTNILSFNTRAIVLFFSLLVGLPWIYFIFELTVLNVLLYYMVQRHETFCAHLLLIWKIK